MALIALRTAEPTTALWGRLIVASAGVSLVAVAIYLAPSWVETKSVGVVVATLVSTGLLAVGACAFALRARAPVVERAAVEIGCLAVALGLTEAVLVGLAPESWSEIHQVQRMIAQQRAASAQGIAYDARLRSDVIRDLKSVGRAAIPGTAPTLLLHPSVTVATSQQGLLPLANASNAYVVECNEGAGYLTYRTDEFGFNNPPGLSSGPIGIAVIGESLALGHCVPPTKSAVDLVRARYPRTANFGVAGARVLSQLGIFREYVEPLRPPVVSRTRKSSWLC
jgi:hypothetical protein